MPRIAPSATARTVSSAGDWVGGTKGLKSWCLGRRAGYGCCGHAFRWVEGVRIVRRRAAGRKTRPPAGHPRRPHPHPVRRVRVVTAVKSALSR